MIRSTPLLVVDGANVVGSRPDGWWRDRAGAADRLIGRIEAALASGRLQGQVLVVLEGQARRATAEPHAGATLTVVRAPGEGDERIVELVGEARADGRSVTVVTADRELTRRVRSLGAEIERPGYLLDRLAPAPGAD